MKKDKDQILTEIRTRYEECGSIIDSIIHTCEQNGIEIETISHYIRYSKELKEKVWLEGLDLKLVKP